MECCSMKFHNILKKLREERELLQKDLAKKLNISSAAYNKLTKSRTVFYILSTYSRVLIDLDYFVLKSYTILS